jgi:hypothetical protein
MMMEITKMKMMEIAKNNHMLSSMNRLFETTQVSQILCVVKMPPPLRSQSWTKLTAGKMGNTKKSNHSFSSISCLLELILGGRE